LDNYDRRWLVPGITEDKESKEYYIALREWLQNAGLGIILNWAQEYITEHSFVHPGEHAPLSEAKKRVIEDSRSEGERLIAQLGEQMIEDANPPPKEKREPKKIVLRLNRVREWLAGRKAALDRRQFGEDGQTKLETPEKISSILRACGLQLPTKRFKVKAEQFRIVTNFPIKDKMEWKDDLDQFEPAQVSDIFPL
jgi:hypothetical protein